MNKKEVVLRGNGYGKAAVTVNINVKRENSILLRSMNNHDLCLQIILCVLKHFHSTIIGDMMYTCVGVYVCVVYRLFEFKQNTKNGSGHVTITLLRSISHHFRCI